MQTFRRLTDVFLSSNCDEVTEMTELHEPSISATHTCSPEKYDSVDLNLSSDEVRTPPCGDEEWEQYAETEGN